jgi:ferritin-like metal-binding protein YciE
MTIDTLYDMFMHDLRSVYYIEKRLLDDLDMMISEATNDDLIDELRDHRSETSEHVQKVERIFSSLDEEKMEHRVKAYDGLSDDVKHLNEEVTETDLINLAFVNSALKVENLEIRLYSDLLSTARRLDMDNQIHDLLQINLDDEKDARKSLKKLKQESSLSRMIKNLLSG